MNFSKGAFISLFAALPVFGPTARAEDITISGGALREFTGDVTFGKLTFGTGCGTALFDAASVTGGWVFHENKSGVSRVEFRNGTVATFSSQWWYAESGSDKGNLVVNDSKLTLSAGMVNGSENANAHFGLYATNSTLVSALLNMRGPCDLEFVGSSWTNSVKQSFGLTGGDSGGTLLQTALFVDSDYVNTKDATTCIGECSPFEMTVSGGSFTLVGSLTLGGWSTSEMPGTRNGWMTLRDGAVLTAPSVYIGVGKGCTGSLTVRNATVCTASISQSNGSGTLVLDGATLRVKTSGGSYFGGLETLTVGADGLTVDTDGKSVTIARSIPSGHVTFAGGGTVKFATGVVVEDYDVRDGTSLVWTDPGETVTIAQPTGKGTRTENIPTLGNDTLVFDVSSGASLDVTGSFRAGVVDKIGGGLLRLANANDNIYSKLILTGGTLEFPALMPSSFTAGFDLTNATASTLAVICNDGDLELEFPETNFAGAFLKRGVGTLTWQRYNRSGAANIWKYFNGHSAPGISASVSLDFSEPETLPTAGFAPFNVAEGRFVMRGLSRTNADLGFNAPCVVSVGGPVTACAAQPELVFENLRASFNTVYVGSYANAATSAIVSPKLTLRDSMMGFSVVIGTGVKNPSFRPEVYLTNSVLSATTYSANVAYNYKDSNSFSVTRVVGGSALRVSTLSLMDPAWFEFDNSELTGSSSSSAVTLGYGDNWMPGANTHTNTFVFANGSRFCFANGVSVNNGVAWGRQTFVFDDSEWDLLPSGDCTVKLSAKYNDGRVEVRGKGLVLKPAADRTMTVTEPLYGSGGLVNRGEGTLVPTAAALVYTGVTRAETGTIAFAGATNANLKIAGPGTFANGALTNATICLAASADGGTTDAPILDLENGLEIQGKTTVDLGSSVLKRPLEGDLTLTVATYTGSTPPDVSGWALKKNAQVRKGTFTAAGGTVTCTPVFRRGFVLMLR